MRREMPVSPNFRFLEAHQPKLVALAGQAERYLADDPAAAVVKLRTFAELLARECAAQAGVNLVADRSFADVLGDLARARVLPEQVRPLFHDLRVAGNAAAHEDAATSGQALHHLKMARQLGIWFHRTFGRAPANFNPGPFIPPASSGVRDAAAAEEMETLRKAAHEAELTAEQARLMAEEERRQRLSLEERARQDRADREVWEEFAKKAEAELNARRASEAAVESLAPKAQQALEKRAYEAADEIDLDEADTRRLVDAQLRAAGWEADTEVLTYSRGARPVAGRNLAIAEWPTDHPTHGKGRADYVLFIGLQAVGVVEAKRKHKDVSAVIGQSKKYSEGFLFERDAQPCGGPWGPLKVPFLFSTNGRPYLKQVENLSGVHFRDGRRKTNHAKALVSWHTPEGLKAMLRQDLDAADKQLRDEPIQYPSLYPHQKKAIEKVEDALLQGRREVLLAMATGTGKTRTAIGLVYRLIKTNRFRRVLFLVDRNALGEQAANAFKDARLEQHRTFNEIYDVKELGDLRPAADTRLQFATVQGLVRRLFFASDDASPLAVDAYDCIVVDECHRGYTLDRELSDEEFGFRNVEDYLSQYRRVLEHFDAVKIGLTATPAQHTTDIFGAPVYYYSYREAVIDRILVDHEPPIRIETKLAKQGIHWAKGAQVPLLNKKTKELSLFRLPDELGFEVDAFNVQVETEAFNRAVCQELAKHLDPTLPEKTLIFCASDAHADLVVRLLNEAFDAKYGEVDDDAVKKITAAATDPMQLFRRYKNEALPNVAVTVDLLTTGIDVPRICNIVFLRRVKSRILYEQMLGRATRLCDEIGKEAFRIFDAVDLYAALEPYTAMAPVVRNPTSTFQQLIDQIEKAKSAEAKQQLLEELVAKLQRKKRSIEGSAERVERFEAATGGKGVAQLVIELRKMGPVKAAAWFVENGRVPELLDQWGGLGRTVAVSDHHDEVVDVTRGYGPGITRPDDYLQGFAKFLRENMNRLPALKVILQRPRELTRKELRLLLLELDAAGYSEKALERAWRDKTQVEVAASIIGFIRQQVLKEPLLPYAQRVQRAVEKLLSSRKWSEPQRKWLKRIAAVLEREHALDRSAFDEAQFAAEGGFERLNKVFDGKLDEVVGELADRVWQEAG